MKILHILKTTNGAEWAFKLICELKNLGHDVYVMLPDANNGKVERYEAVGVKTVILDAALPVRRFWKFFPMRRAFRKAVAEIAPDIIHTKSRQFFSCIKQQDLPGRFLQCSFDAVDPCRLFFLKAGFHGGNGFHIPV